MAATTSRVPDLGRFQGRRGHRRAGEGRRQIDVDTPLITLETEKATMDVPSTAAGVVKSVAIKKGDRVSKGNVIVLVEGPAAAAAAKQTPQPAAPAAAPTAKAPARPRRQLLRRQKPSAARLQPAPAAAAAPHDRAADHHRRSRLRDALTRARRSASSRASSASISAASRAPAQGPHHARRREGVRQAGAHSAARRAPAAARCRRCPRSTSRSSARSRSSRSAASRRFPVRACRRAGSTSRTSRRSTKRTSPSWRRRAPKLKGEASKAGIKLTPLAFILRACVKALQRVPAGQLLARCRRGQNLVSRNTCTSASRPTRRTAWSCR